MTQSPNLDVDPQLDLVLERVVDVSPELVWKAWTQPQHLKKWFAPAPWSVSECEIDLRPGGMFRTVMVSPEGEAFPNMGCYLEVVPHEKLVFTDALAPGYRPTEKPFFTAVLTLEPHPQGTIYRVVAKHRDEAGKQEHEEMGFHQGWSICLDQLVAMVKALAPQ